MFEPSPVRRGLDQLLSFYPHLDLIEVEWQMVDHPLGFPIGWGTWVLVTLGQPSEGEHPAFALWYFAIFIRTGAVHTMRGPGGEVSDDPLFPVPS